METLNIAKLCGISEDKFHHGLSVETLVLEKKEPSIKKELETVLQKNQERRENKMRLYKSILKRCVEKIKLQNSLRRTDMILYVDDFMIDCNYYDRDECINYLIQELRKNYFDISPLPHKLYEGSQFSKSSLFISWKFAEYHKKSQLFTNPNKDIH